MQSCDGDSILRVRSFVGQHIGTGVACDGRLSKAAVVDKEKSFFGFTCPSGTWISKKDVL